MERDYPVGHPAASDYNGAPYNAPRAPWTDDFPSDHPARGGKNTSEVDSPDGMRKLTIEVRQANEQRMREVKAEAIASDTQPQQQQRSVASTTITITGDVRST